MIDNLKEHEKYIKSIITRKKKIFISRLLILVIFFALWEIAGDLNWIDPFLTSTPSRMFKNLIKLYLEGTLFKHIGITCIETIIGFLLSTILGTLIAILLWLSDFVSDVLDPYLVVLNALPKIALAPIIIFWVGNGMSAIVMVTVLICIVVTILTVLNGFREVDKDKIRLLKTFGASRFQILTHLIMPASVPTLVSTLKINVGLSWVGVIMGEFLVAKEGLGFLIIYGGQISQLDTVMVSIIILAVLAYLMYKLVELAENKIKKKLMH
ncbi:MAG: ABC transporter permease [Clostridium tyrobutyricum]|jgi:NitT/TauT family transport system permease protein|uniref:ABC transporter permease n=1 Tax=Clostridium tyrobutyricum TaxID=1519 RepID=UPI001C381A9F|nr:ABC transporter permease [Clostridium tyrobutyricum]MBV4441410.1 ABC transporter permease [Clostridium tyrobutyricum]MBV4446470.1 ABC transporter permease [Clostridium tyrobutyricum]MCH4200392.1 ABC transporter permease [Clostridium tyrobutyricum]MCH4260095.1 ABC transporter permease [Clostridium tyrobutyricum]MCI1651177.1 ABC transporter permease [Clostridium tyrobutyricum]